MGAEHSGCHDIGYADGTLRTSMLSCSKRLFGVGETRCTTRKRMLRGTTPRYQRRMMNVIYMLLNETSCRTGKKDQTKHSSTRKKMNLSHQRSSCASNMRARGSTDWRKRTDSQEILALFRVPNRADCITQSSEVGLRTVVCYGLCKVAWTGSHDLSGRSFALVFLVLRVILAKAYIGQLLLGQVALAGLSFGWWTELDSPAVVLLNISESRTAFKKCLVARGALTSPRLILEDLNPVFGTFGDTFAMQFSQTPPYLCEWLPLSIHRVELCVVSWR